MSEVTTFINAPEKRLQCFIDKTMDAPGVSVLHSCVAFNTAM